MYVSHLLATAFLNLLHISLHLTDTSGFYVDFLSLARH